MPYTARNIHLPTPDFGFKKEPATAASSAADAAAATTNGSSVSEKTAEAMQENGAKSAPSKKRRYDGAHVVAKKDDEIRGHTAFLTFAFKFFE